MPDKPFHYECYTDNSEDPAVEADCPDECGGGSHLDEVDGTMKYSCECEVSSAEECAEKYPGEGACRMQGMPHRLLTQLEPCKVESRAVWAMRTPAMAGECFLRGVTEQSCRSHDRQAASVQG